MSDYYGRVFSPQPLNDEDRHHGQLSLELLKRWRDWVKRRVESIEFVNDTTVRRRVSIDFRVRSWLPDPMLDWPGTDGVHYFPLAMLKKRPLANFDVRDESGQAISLLTRRKNAAIGASVLAAYSQTLVYSELTTIEKPPPIVDRWPKDGVSARELRVHQDVENDFVRIAYLPFVGMQEHDDAKRVLGNFIGEMPTPLRPLAAWKWSLKDGTWTADATPAEWRMTLASDPSFRILARDFAELFMVTVPVNHEPKRRRIIKFCYDEPRGEPLVSWKRPLKKTAKATHLDAALTRVEDFLEGLPYGGLDPDSEWLLTNKGAPPPMVIGPFRKFLRGIGWQAHEVEFDAPAVAEGGSYHLEIEAPEGLQIRRAAITALDSVTNEVLQSHGERGARGLQRVHLYVGGLPRGSTGRAAVSLKARASTIIRAAFFGAVLGFVLLLGARLKLGDLTDPDRQVIGPTAAVFLLIPGFLTALAARSSEHPLTTSLVFGIRVLTMLVAAWPIVGAAMLVGLRDSRDLPVYWGVLLGLSLLTVAVLFVTWRLASRRRPDGTAP